MKHAQLISIYLVALVAEVLGLVFTVQRFTLGQDTDGVPTVAEVSPWRRRWLRWGPALLGTGLVLGAAGNILSLYTE